VNQTQSCACTNGNANCTQTCQYVASGYYWSDCSGGSVSPAGSAYVSCTLTNTNSDLGTVTVSGDVLGNLFNPNNDTSAVYEICLVGDASLGGWTGNRTHCQNYGSGYTYTWTNLSFPSSVNRFTFLGVTNNGGERWSDNAVLVRSGVCALGDATTTNLYFANDQYYY
jgi:hypothetical protein